MSQSATGLSSETHQAVAAVTACLSSRRFRLDDEKRLQDEIADAFAADGLPFEKEVRLSPSDVVDFLVGGIAVEVKLRGQRRAILGQCERYCGHGHVRGLVLVTNAAMGMPAEINGKPVRLLSLGAAWL